MYVPVYRITLTKAYSHEYSSGVKTPIVTEIKLGHVIKISKTLAKRNLKWKIFNFIEEWHVISLYIRFQIMKAENITIKYQGI